MFSNLKIHLTLRFGDVADIKRNMKAQFYTISKDEFQICFDNENSLEYVIKQAGSPNNKIRRKARFEKNTKKYSSPKWQGW